MHTAKKEGNSMGYYTNILLANFNRIVPTKKKSYVSIIENTYHEHKSVFATTILLNLVAMLITIFADVMIAVFQINFVDSLFIHLGLMVYYILHFNMYRNNLVFSFAYIFMIVALFIFEYWILTFFFIMIGTMYILHVLNAETD